MIVDVMNVVGSRPDGWWRDRVAAVDDTIRKLDALSADTGRAIVAVVDGAPDLDLEGIEIEVIFTTGPGRGLADDAIVALLEEDEVPSTVITSDEELSRRARLLGARVEGAGGFRSRIDPY